MAASDFPISAKQEIKTRRVHYISGFDPRGPRFYHRLYREESAKQSQLNGSVLHVGDRRKISPDISAWSVQGDWNGQSVTTAYEFMSWDDIVRENWDANLLKLLGRAIPTYIRYYRDGCFHRIWGCSKGIFKTALFPPVFFLGLAFVILLQIVLVTWLATILHVPAVIGLVVALVIAFFLGRSGYRIADRMGALWLVRDYNFLLTWGTGPVPSIEKRIREMAEHIWRRQQEEPVDEVLIIGHSFGSIVAAAVTARILEKKAEGTLPSGIKLFTLGQGLPMMGFIRSAEAFRRDMEILGNDETIPWVDASAPPDPLGFFKVDPLRICGITPRFDNRPRLASVRVFRMFTSSTYKKLRRDKFRLHFQYLMASEVAADYDYFRITAGPGKLAAEA